MEIGHKEKWNFRKMEIGENLSWKIKTKQELWEREIGQIS